MTVIESLRARMPECSHISDEDLLKMTEGTFLRASAEMSVAIYEMQTAAQPLTSKLRKILDWMMSR